MRFVCVAEGSACCHQSHETYNGWPNRETWAAHLWITNDQGLTDYFQSELKDIRRDLQSEDKLYGTLSQVACHRLSNSIKDWFESQASLLVEGQCHRDTALALGDIGSLWRVDWDAIAKALRDGQ